MSFAKKSAGVLLAGLVMPVVAGLVVAFIVDQSFRGEVLRIGPRAIVSSPLPVWVVLLIVFLEGALFTIAWILRARHLANDFDPRAFKVLIEARSHLLSELMQDNTTLLDRLKKRDAEARSRNEGFELVREELSLLEFLSERCAASMDEPFLVVMPIAHELLTRLRRACVKNMKGGASAFDAAFLAGQVGGPEPTSPKELVAYYAGAYHFNVYLALSLADMCCYLPIGALSVHRKDRKASIDKCVSRWMAANPPLSASAVSDPDEAKQFSPEPWIAEAYEALRRCRQEIRDLKDASPGSPSQENDEPPQHGREGSSPTRKA